MSTAINRHRETIQTITELSFAGLILQQIRDVPKEAHLEDSGTVFFILEGFWYELSRCSLYTDQKDVIAVTAKGGTTLEAWNGNSIQLEEGIWRVSGN